MKKNRIAAIEYIRGISMLGVIGIHTGAQYLSNPFSNIHLIALFEIFTRFSVPIFFFVSAFGLFYHLDIKGKFSYKNFMKRRFKAVLIPYITWSMLYLLHYSLVYHDFSLWNMKILVKSLFFGLASYQLYFLVILLWFYALMPCWIFLIRHMTPLRLGILLAVQILFDYYSSFLILANSPNAYLQMLLEYRLNFWVFHYLFIFILGGYAAVHSEAFNARLKKSYGAVHIFFYTSLAALLAHYYYLIYCRNYSAESAINTAHQLSPAGIFYTIGASLFFFAIFSYANIPATLHRFLSLLGKHSYFAYLFHPFVIYYLSLFVSRQRLLMTASVAIAFYCAVVLLSVFAAALARRVGEYFPRVNALLIGVYEKK